MTKDHLCAHGLDRELVDCKQCEADAARNRPSNHQVSAFTAAEWMSVGLLDKLVPLADYDRLHAAIVDAVRKALGGSPVETEETDNWCCEHGYRQHKRESPACELAASKATLMESRDNVIAERDRLAQELRHLENLQDFTAPLSCDTHGLVPNLALFDNKCPACERDRLRAIVSEQQRNCSCPYGDCSTCEKAKAALSGEPCAHTMVEPGSTLTVIDPYKAKCRVCYEFFDLPLRSPLEMTLSRSVQRREAAMRGKPAPEFGAVTWTCEACGMRGRSLDADVCANCGCPKTNGAPTESGAEKTGGEQS